MQCNVIPLVALNKICSAINDHLGAALGHKQTNSSSESESSETLVGLFLFDAFVCQ